MDAENSKNIVHAFKNLTASVKLRNLKVKNKSTRTVVGDAPLGYPLIS
jgi:hypothetical protein